VNYGFLPEFVNRFGVITRFQALTGDELRAVLRLEKGPLRRFERMFEEDGVSLTFSDDALDAIALKAQRRGGGGRALNAVLETVVLEVSYEIMREDGVRRTFQLDSDYVRRALT
jgi:ATP-dependent Clp protease ATP-binding subunit ClpX